MIKLIIIIIVFELIYIKRNDDTGNFKKASYWKGKGSILFERKEGKVSFIRKENK